MDCLTICSCTCSDSWLARSWFHPYKFLERSVAKLDVLFIFNDESHLTYMSVLEVEILHFTITFDYYAYRYSYKIGHKLLNGSYIWSKTYAFKSSPFPGQESLQQIVVVGDIGKVYKMMFS